MCPSHGCQTPRRHGPPDDAVLSARLLAEEAVDQGATVQWVHRACFIATIDGRPVGFWCARTDLVASVAEHLTRRKDLTHEVLQQAGLPTIATRSFPAEAPDLASEQLVHGQDHTVKPAEGRQGRGVTVGVTTIDQFDSAWATAVAAGASWILIQPTVLGREIRLLVVEGEVIAVAEKRPASVVGDGRRTIGELLDDGNRERRANPFLAPYPLTFSEVGRPQRRHTDIDEMSVLADGEHLQLSRKASISDGGTNHDLTGWIHPDLERLASAAVRSFPGLGVAGVDVIVTDPLRPADARILEINSMPGLGLHHFPVTGAPQPAAARIVEATLRAAARRTDDGRTR